MSTPRSFASILVATLAVLLSGLVAAQDAPLRVGVLKFGTVNWELDVIKHHALAGEPGFERVPLASTRATAVALQGGAADVIVSDWIWVARQRADGRNYTFVPYSRLVGGIMVGADSGIEKLADLRDRKVGVAGGPIDKSWLLMRAYSRRTLDADLAEITRPSYAAPPLLNELALRGELPAVLNYWHFAARLEAGGMRRLISTADVLERMDISEEVPLLGWVFDESLATARRADLMTFLEASSKAKDIMVNSDAEWQRLRPRLKTDDDGTANALRDAWRNGVPGDFGVAQQQAAAKVFEILVSEGGRELAGNATSLPEGTFFAGFK